MGPRRTITKLACLILIGPILVFSIYILNTEHQVRRSDLSLWINTDYEKLLQYNGQSLSSAGDTLLNFLSPNSKTKSTSNLVGVKTMEETEEWNVTKLREEVKIALKRLKIANKKMSGREVLKNDPNTDVKPGWKVAYSPENKARISQELHERVSSNTQKEEEDMDQLLTKILETRNENDGYLDEGDTELEDDPNLNADVKRAVPVLQVKRYVDEPIDPHEYQYIHNPSHRCFNSDGQPRRVFILFMVVTAPGHFQRRDVIRHTYGSEKEWPPLKRGVFTTVFLLGKTFNDTLQKMIDVEHQTHGDIVQEDFVDTYANLSRKTVMGLKWTTKHCRHALFTMKIDDDSMINQGRFLWIFKESTLKNWTASETLIDAPVLRNTTSKYFISENYYPAPTYPPYMNGPGYLLSTDLVESSYHMALQTPLFPWEDVFLGTCLQKMGFQPVYHKRFLWISYPSFFSQNSERAIETTVRSYVVLSNLQPDIMKFIWFSCKMKLNFKHK